jgi:hypothetical protein
MVTASHCFAKTFLIEIDVNRILIMRANSLLLGCRSLKEIDRRSQHIGEAFSRCDVREGAMGDVSFLRKLWALFRASGGLLDRSFDACPLPSCGHEVCFCVHHNNEYFILGRRTLVLTGPNGELFTARDLILHYISAHGYRPSVEFVNAVTECDLEMESSYVTHLTALRFRFLRDDEQEQWYIERGEWPGIPPVAIRHVDLFA